MPRFSLVALLPPAVLLAGCATDDGGKHPSLAPRAVERLSFAEPDRPAPVLTPDPALDARIVAQGARLDQIAASFTTAADTARRATAAAAKQAVGSDAWLDAQAALAQLDDRRAQASALAAEIEAEGAARAAKLLPAYPTLEALGTRAAAEADREATTTAELQASLPTG